LLRQRHPRTLRVAVLLDKAGRRVRAVKTHYTGFRIPDEFVVGYGLDYAGRYRNLNDICILSLPDESIPGKPTPRPGSRARKASQ
jgi:hypoxanthine phosphoribosyltransferase